MSLTLVVCLCFISIDNAFAQTEASGYEQTFKHQFAIKTNLLYGFSTLTPNVLGEVSLSPKTSLEVLVGYNPFTFKENKKWKHFLIQPSFRYWFCDVFNAGFIGVHAHYAYANGGNFTMPFGVFKDTQNYRCQGDIAGAGVSIGYQWPLAKHWGFEVEFGAGVSIFWYKKYECPHCGRYIDKDRKTFVGPTKAAMKLIYQF